MNFSTLNKICGLIGVPPFFCRSKDVLLSRGGHINVILSDYMFYLQFIFSVDILIY